MRNVSILKRAFVFLCCLCLVMSTFMVANTDAGAIDFPTITVSFDPRDESVIIEGVKDLTPGGPYLTSVEGYLNYGKERIETFCYGPQGKAYDIPDVMGYILNWKDHEFILPCSGEYDFTCYITVTYWDNASGKEIKEKGPKTTIKIYLNKEDESTNWGPGLPNTTIETYTLEQIKGKDKTIEIVEPEYSWNIKGTDIIEVPDANMSLKIVTNPDPYAYENVQEFFGMALAYMLGIEHNGPFGFTAHLRYNMGADYVGKFAHLFYVVGDGTFVYMGSSLVEADGYAIFPFDHASEYIIAVTNEEYTGQELNPKAEVEAEDEAKTGAEGEAEDGSGTTGDVTESGSAGPDDVGGSLEGTGSGAGEGAGEVNKGSETDGDAEDEASDRLTDKEKEELAKDEAGSEGKDKGDTTTIGIIGGADGPTAIFVAGDIGGLVFWVVGAIVVVGVIIGVVWGIKRKK